MALSILDLMGMSQPAAAQMPQPKKVDTKGSVANTSKPTGKGPLKPGSSGGVDTTLTESEKKEKQDRETVSRQVAIREQTLKDALARFPDLTKGLPTYNKLLTDIIDLDKQTKSYQDELGVLRENPILGADFSPVFEMMSQTSGVKPVEIKPLIDRFKTQQKIAEGSKATALLREKLLSGVDMDSLKYLLGDRENKGLVNIYNGQQSVKQEPTPPAKGGSADSQFAKALKTQQAKILDGFRLFNVSLSEYKDLIEKHGAEVTGAVAARMNTLRDKMKQAQGMMAGYGSLTGQESKIAGAGLPEMGVTDFSSAMGALGQATMRGGKSGAISNLEELKRSAEVEQELVKAALEKAYPGAVKEIQDTWNIIPDRQEVLESRGKAGKSKSNYDPSSVLDKMNKIKNGAK